METEVTKAAIYIQTYLKEVRPKLGMILGSGLGILADELKNAIKIPYQDIPYFPISTVKGHKGQLVIGSLQGTLVVVMQGRFHFYEGYSLDQVTFPIRMMKVLGVETLIVTNAAGGINTMFKPGDFMLISDHINHMGTNPFIGRNHNSKTQAFRFKTSSPYCQTLREKAKQVARQLELPVKEGVYVANSGPCYETPAEVQMLRKLGGDAVGMSTVPEVMVASEMGLNVLGISCISNMAAGILEKPLNHEEVMETTNMVKERFLMYIKALINML